MGIIDWMRRQLIDIVEWPDQPRHALTWRFPRQDNEIKNGAQLVVREGQVAIFVNEGQLADVFKPGLYTLSTQNLPLLSSLRGWKHGFESPFKCEVTFVSTLPYLEMKWGTTNPITLRDPDFGLVRVRAHGIYTIRVDEGRAPVFFRELVGADRQLDTSEIEGQLRAMLVSAFTQALAKANVPALDLAQNLDMIAARCKSPMDIEFSEYGLKLTKFVIQSVSLPPDVEKAIDERASMGAVGNLGHYAQFQAARSLGQSGAGGVGAMVGMGAAMAMGHQLAQGVAGFAQPAQQAKPNLEDRLQKLKTLKDGGLIDDATFARRRDELLSEL
jgi:membrane protease subunit (stomatin/prohibitin family)